MTREEHLLIILAEECNEVGQRACKVLRFRFEDVEPGQDLTNRERLQMEFADLLAVYEMLGMFTPTEGQKEAKRNKVERFLSYSESLGLVDK